MQNLIGVIAGLALFIALGAGFIWLDQTAQNPSQNPDQTEFEAALAASLCTGSSDDRDPLYFTRGIQLTLPEMTAQARQGATVFAAHCAACHGDNGIGVAGSGPPLIHAFYAPERHPDSAILRAVQTGARGHHWTFGNMPPVTGLRSSEIFNIIAFIRALQKANGITG